MDMEAGIEHPGRRTAEAVDVMVIVVEPGLKSFETAERIKKLAGDIGIKNITGVINKVSTSSEKEGFHDKKLSEIDVRVIGTIPRDITVIKADMEGKALVDYLESAAMRSIEKIAQKILEYDSRKGRV